MDDPRALPLGDQLALFVFVCQPDAAVRDRQIARLERVRGSRDQAACQAALAALTEAAGEAAGQQINLLERAVEAARRRATVGEITAALEKVYTRHRAVIR
ncbi:MAG: hypothetical protein IH849_07255, partial [Acidobacteria bacterium]|nr:hypothetical protein [Acidobacteriota bacterium]